MGNNSTDFGDLVSEWKIPFAPVHRAARVNAGDSRELLQRANDLSVTLQSMVNWQEFERACRLFSDRKYSDTVEICTELLGEYGNLPGLYYLRAAASGSLGEYAAAIADFTSALKYAGPYPQYLRERARAYRAIGDNEHAEQDEIAAAQS